MFKGNLRNFNISLRRWCNAVRVQQSAPYRLTDIHTQHLYHNTVVRTVAAFTEAANSRDASAGLVSASITQKSSWISLTAEELC